MSNETEDQPKDLGEPKLNSGAMVSIRLMASAGKIDHLKIRRFLEKHHIESDIKVFTEGTDTHCVNAFSITRAADILKAIRGELTVDRIRTPLFRIIDTDTPEKTPKEWLEQLMKKFRSSMEKVEGTGAVESTTAKEAK